MSDFTITTPIPPIPEQVQYLWENGGRDALAKVIANRILRKRKSQDEGAIPADLQVGEFSGIMQPIALEEVP